MTLALSRYNVDDWACNSAEIKSSRGEASSRLSFSEQGKYFLLPCMKGGAPWMQIHILYLENTIIRRIQCQCIGRLIEDIQYTI